MAKCPQCNKEFKNKWANKYCSKTCSNRFNAKKPEVRAKVGNPILKLPKEHPSRQKFYKNLIPGIGCPKGHPFYKGGEKGWFTSQNGQKFQGGEKNVNWKGGISALIKPIRETLWTSTPYKNWRKLIFAKNKYSCQICYKTGRKNYLEAHHIRPFKDYPESVLDENNGITLCKRCHRLVHKFKVEPYLQFEGGVIQRG